MRKSINFAKILNIFIRNYSGVKYNKIIKSYNGYLLGSIIKRTLLKTMKELGEINEIKKYINDSNCIDFRNITPDVQERYINKFLQIIIKVLNSYNNKYHFYKDNLSWNYIKHKKIISLFQKNGIDIINVINKLIYYFNAQLLKQKNCQNKLKPLVPPKKPVPHILYNRLSFGKKYPYDYAHVDNNGYRIGGKQTKDKKVKKPTIKKSNTKK